MDSIIDIPFTKMSGAGNDFVIIDNSNGVFTVEWDILASVVSNRHFGIGADGLLVIDRSNVSDFKMLYYNADGSYGGMCGNGGRCIAAFVMDKFKKSSITFEALEFIYSARKNEKTISLSMKNPKSLILNAQLAFDGSNIKYNYIDTGSPHVVIFHEELPDKLLSSFEDDDIKAVGKLVRYHEQFRPNGTNVNIVRISGDQILSMRTYERGVEDETLACGTGTVACAVIGNMLLNLSSPVTIKARSGEILTVSFTKADNQFTSIELSGSAHVVFRGIFTYNMITKKIVY